jgi:hypothetical protein
MAQKPGLTDRLPIDKMSAQVLPEGMGTRHSYLHSANNNVNVNNAKIGNAIIILRMSNNRSII